MAGEEANGAAVRRPEGMGRAVGSGEWLGRYTIERAQPKLLLAAAIEAGKNKASTIGRQRQRRIFRF
jgi:hypothetical protein